MNHRFDAPGPCGGGPVEPDEFRLGYTGSDFKWAGETRPGLPVLRWPGGAICEPALLYFCWSARVGRVAPSSMRPEAYALREWLAFLWSRGASWHQGSDALLRGWREEQLSKASKTNGRKASKDRAGRPMAEGALLRQPSPRRIEAKIAMVFNFYSAAPEALCLEAAAGMPSEFVGSVRATPKRQITSKEPVFGVFGNAVPQVVWEGAGRPGRRRVKRGTPTADDVARLLTHMRSRAATEPTNRPTKGASAQSRLEAERNWLVARCECEAGLRAEEVAGLRLCSIAEGLAEAGAGGRALRRSALAEALATMDQRQRTTILAGLDAMVAKGRRQIGVEVTCKGATRTAPFAIGLMRDLVEIGIWTVREALVGQWLATGGGYAPPAVAFLSSKTGEAMLPGTVADLVADAFADLGLRGSGHRLRAHFATELAVRLLQERLPLNGGIYDGAVENWVLLHVAEALGHASVSTTTRHYVDLALMRLLGRKTNGTTTAGRVPG